MLSQAMQQNSSDSIITLASGWCHSTYMVWSLLSVVCVLLPLSSAIAEVTARGEVINILQNDTMPNDSYPVFSKNPAINSPNATDPLYIPNSEPKIEFDNNLTPEENADIWQRIKEGYAMPDAESSLVKRHEKAFSDKPKMLTNMVERSQKYLFHIVEEVQNRGMPTEIALLPMIESAYNPNAYSTSKAAGIWQFIPSTGKNYGLKQNWWVDNRRNITFATDAALSYLQKLHVMFGAWDLALAAYNAGEGTVRRAIEKNKKLGKPTNYDSLDLPKETENYVPKLQAIKNIMTNPANFGIKLKSIENKAYFTTVTAPSQIDAKIVAELAEIPFDDFIALNPSFNRPVITASSDTQELLLPVTSVALFHQNLSTYDKPLVNWKPYNVKAGELLSTIATKYDIPLDKLRKVNQLSVQNKFSKPTIILVPNKNQLTKLAEYKLTEEKLAEVKTQATVLANQPSANLVNSEQSNTEDSTDHQIIESDVDFSALQNAGNIDVKNLESLQNIQHNDAVSEPKKKSAITVIVKKGDTLDKIAQKYNIPIKTLASINHLKKSQVKVGQKLLLEPATIDKNLSNKKSSKQNTSAKKTTNTKTKNTATQSKLKTPTKNLKIPTKNKVPIKNKVAVKQKTKDKQK